MSDPKSKADSYRSLAQIDEFLVLERSFSGTEDNLSIGLANIHAIVPGIESNKDKIARACNIFKERGANIAIFPEFALSGYVWDDELSCRPYIEQASIENHLDWIKQVIQPLFDDTFKGIVLNTFRHEPDQGYYNTTFLIAKNNDWRASDRYYDKVFLPPAERPYTITGGQDRLDLESPWGKFGFATCYDMMFSQLLQEYAFLDEVDAVIEVASWRAAARRDYPGMNVGTDTYYGDLWNMVLASKAAINQVWMIACNAVGVHRVSGAQFWGGSGLWSPSGMKLIQASHFNEELLIIHNVDIKGQRQREKDDFDYAVDFNAVYRPIHGKRAFTRIH